MNLAKFESLLPLLMCPDCRIGSIVAGSEEENLKCVSCGSQFPVSHGRLILLGSKNDLFDVDCIQYGDDV